MKFPAIKFSQTNYDIITTVLPFEIINAKSKALIYGDDDGGYQRKQDEKHFQNIKKYILLNEFVFPNSIILACDSDNLKKILVEEKNNTSFLELTTENERLFRIVDGQHRLLGINEAIKQNPQLKKLNLQVNIISTLPNKRSVEMDIFNNINSKSKRLKTDLIELARYDYRIIEKKVKDEELVSHISINTAFELNENTDKTNIWQNAIKIDIHSENKIGIIGVKAFNESIQGIVGNFINQKNDEIKKFNDLELISFSRNSAKTISAFISSIWEIVHKKWPTTFLEPYKSLDVDSLYKFIAYNPEYYIQKTLGCKSINYLVSDLLKEKQTNISDPTVLVDFEKIIQESKLNDNDWKLGKTLSGISSESGFKKVTNIIRNRELFIRKD